MYIHRTTFFGQNNLAESCLTNSYTPVVWHMKTVNVVMKYHIHILFVLALGCNGKINICAKNSQPMGVISTLVFWDNTGQKELLKSKFIL